MSYDVYEKGFVYTGNYKGYSYLIRRNDVLYQIPVAYIRINENIKLMEFLKDHLKRNSSCNPQIMAKIPLNVNGGLTFAGFLSPSTNDVHIGWDYGHLGKDYCQMPPEWPLDIPPFSEVVKKNKIAKKWTFEEILAEVHAAIEDIIEKYS